MTLITEDGRLSSIVLTVDGADRCSDEHAGLFGLLLEPFSILLSRLAGAGTTIRKIGSFKHRKQMFKETRVVGYRLGKTA